MEATTKKNGLGLLTIRLYPVLMNPKNISEKNFSFPLNNYKFLKFDFLDKNSLPINVLEAGLEYDNVVANAKTALQNFEQK